MTSGSPRDRVDKFFASKRKRKSSSPFKLSRNEKDEKVTVGGSPSAKGNLDGYLKRCEDGDQFVRHSYSDNCSSEVLDSARRNLVADMEKHARSEYTEPSLWAGLQQYDKSEATLKKMDQSSSGLEDVAAEGETNDYPLSTNQTENVELRQFANNFLSLYCSELQSTVQLDTKCSGNKRLGSPSFMDNKCQKSTKRLHLSMEQKDDHHLLSNGDNAVETVPTLVLDVSKGDFNISTEIDVSNTPAKLESSLRKCNQAQLSTVDLTACHTPASLLIKSNASKTPRSTCGSSIFSPGEAFWSEAVKLADGLCNPTHSCGLKTITNRSNPDPLQKLLTSSQKNSEIAAPGPSESRTHLTGIGHLDSAGNIEDTVRKLSPLPVKHFDFTSDGKTLGIDYVHKERNLHQTESKPVFNDQNDDTDDPGLILHGGNTIFAKPEMDEACTPSSRLSGKDQLDLSRWLPSVICNIYRNKGIVKLYEWQVDCLLVEGVLERRNLVYCASTSAGKSFVAEILMLRRLLSTRKIAMLVLPYVSICAEKAEHLEALLEPLGKHVRSYYGNQGGGILPKDTSVAVCTIEKANSLLNRLLEEGRLSEVGIIVIDELHMVGDPHRGYLLELMLTKLRYAAGEGNPGSTSGESSNSSSGKGDFAHGLQIVGMSATMPNVAAVADWLQAALYQTDFRPVPLEEYVKVGNSIYSQSMEIVRTISKAADLDGKDPDHIVELCDETVQDGHSVLIFCSSRKGCESTARHVAKFLMKFSAVLKRSDDDFPDTTSALDALRRSPAGLDPILEETLPCGVAYHHAGLTVEEREVVETCYRKGLVRVLTATSTLAAGVNLPARRVIFRQPRVGRDFIDGTRYKQMAGRAGRTGIDTKGESILICKPEEVKRIMGLLNEKCPLLDSCLSEDKNGMTHAILEVVAGGIVQSAHDINRYVRCTLLNSTKPFEAVVKSAQDSLRWLCQRKFLEWSEETKLYGTTPLGRAAFGSSLTPEESLTVLEDLSRAREGFVLASDLHLVYIITPTNIDIEPDWELYYQRFMELSGLDQSVANRVGVVEPFLMRMAHCAPTHSTERSKGKAMGNRGKGEKLSTVASKVVLQKEQALRVCKRFYVALILSRLVEEVPVAEVCEAYKVARGMIQALQENAGRFASMVSVFCERLGWHDMEGLVCKFQNRVSFGVRAEIVELTSIPYVKGSRARALYKAGLRTPVAIAEASIPEIVKALFECSSYANKETSSQRRLQVGIAKKIKNGARKIVLDKAEEARVAAFSAFQSLGFDVTHFSRPMLTSVDKHAKQGGTYSGDGTQGTVSAAPNASAEEAIVESKESDKIMESGDEILESNPISHSVATAVVRTPFLPSQVEASCHPASLTGQPTTKASSTAPASGKEADMICFSKPEASVNGDRSNDDIDCPEKLGQNDNQHLHFLCRDPGFDKGPIGVVTMPGGLDYFLDIWDSTSEFYFEIHYNKRKEANDIVPFEIHGIAICWDSSPVYYVNFSKDLLKTAKKNINCLTYGVSSDGREKTLSHSLLDMVHSRWNRISNIMGKKNVRKFTWNFKVQIRVLKNAAISIHRVGLPGIARKDLGFQLIDNSFLVLPSIDLKSVIDMSVVAWILWPDEERSSNPNIEKVNCVGWRNTSHASSIFLQDLCSVDVCLHRVYEVWMHQEVKRRLSVEAAAAAHRCGRWRNQMKRPAHDGCCRRVAQTRALRSVLWKLVIHEELLEPLDKIEIPLVNVLADMELWGVGVDMEGCLRARNLLGKKISHLEKEAYSLAGISFSLYTAADVANVLYGHLKLPMPEASSKGKRHPSTDKQCLDLLRHEHPIIPIIKEHRTLTKLLNCTLGPICSLAKLSMASQKYTVHGHWLQTSTSTGRLSVEEPNLQCVEHSVEFEFNKDDDVGGNASIHHNINARDFIVPTQEDCLLLAADYSQIELRLMAHFSGDASLIELLSQPHGDVFTMIAARWTGKAEETVSSNEREQTKRMVYGILYGMGSKSLAEQLDCRPDEATEKIKNFKATFPGVASWLGEAVCLCRQKGYIETLNGRKRFFSKIKFGNDREKLKAQRQAVNSICQGSAADIIKIAMINIHAIIVGGVDCKYDSTCQLASKFHILKGKCRILLQVHDELVLEVDPRFVKDAAILLKESMENAVSLRVPLRVKLKVGRSWGSLEDFHAENYVNTV